MTAEYVDLLVLRFGLERAYFDRIGRSDGASGKSTGSSGTSEIGTGEINASRYN